MQHEKFLTRKLSGVVIKHTGLAVRSAWPEPGHQYIHESPMTGAYLLLWSLPGKLAYSHKFSNGRSGRWWGQTVSPFPLIARMKALLFRWAAWDTGRVCILFSWHSSSKSRFASSLFTGFRKQSRFHIKSCQTAKRISKTSSCRMASRYSCAPGTSPVSVCTRWYAVACNQFSPPEPLESSPLGHGTNWSACQQL